MRCCQEILYGIIQMAQAFLIIDAMHLATAGIFDAQLTKLVLSLHAYFTGLSDELVSKSSSAVHDCRLGCCSSMEKISPRSPVHVTLYTFSDDRKRRLLTVDILSRRSLHHATTARMFTIRKPKGWKDIDWQSEAALGRIIFFPIPPFLSSHPASWLLLFLMQWPKPMITRLLLLPKENWMGFGWLIHRRENASSSTSSSSSWHPSDKYWGLENRKSYPILEVLINFLLHRAQSNPNSFHNVFWGLSNPSQGWEILSLFFPVMSYHRKLFELRVCTLEKFQDLPQWIVTLLWKKVSAFICRRSFSFIPFLISCDISTTFQFQFCGGNNHLS